MILRCILYPHGHPSVHTSVTLVSHCPDLFHLSDERAGLYRVKYIYFDHGKSSSRSWVVFRKQYYRYTVLFSLLLMRLVVLPILQELTHFNSSKSLSGKPLSTVVVSDIRNYGILSFSLQRSEIMCCNYFIICESPCYMSSI